MTGFKCDACGHKFVGPDMEYAATIFSAPVKCPNCGSMHTMPSGLFKQLYRGMYKSIWKSYDKQMERKNGENK